jgi:hypothetical protein
MVQYDERYGRKGAYPADVATKGHYPHTFSYTCSCVYCLMMA